MSDAPSQTQDKFIVRLPEGLRDRIRAEAEANNRSMNAEIVQAIEYYLKRPRFEIDTGPPLDPNDYDGSNEDGFYSQEEESEQIIRKSMHRIERDLRAFLAKAKR